LDAQLAQDFALITFQHNGHSFELLNQGDAERAVMQGRIAPDTQVTVYASDGGISAKRAVDVPAIAALLTAPTPTFNVPEPAPETPLSSAPVVPTPDGEDYLLRNQYSDGHDGPAYLVRWSVEADAPFEAGDIVCIIQTEHAIIRIPAPGTGVLTKKLLRTHAPVLMGTPLAMLRLIWRPDKELAPDIRYFTPADEPPAAAPPPAPEPLYPEPPAQRGKMGCGLWLSLIIGLLAIVVIVNNWADTTGEDQARNAAVSVNNADISAPDFRPPGEVVGRFIARRAAAFPLPSEMSKSNAQLERGGGINGIYIRNTAGEDWLWLADGANMGQFLRASDLSQRAPPTLLEQQERSATLATDTTVFVWPDNAATAQVDRDGTSIIVTAGASVTVVGGTENEFYEIILTDDQGGGVGYIARAAIDGGVVAAQGSSLMDRGISLAKRAIKKGAKLALSSSSSAPALKVTNRCPMTATILFYYRAQEGWTHHNGASWDYDAGGSGYPTLPIGDRLYPVNGELFYAAAPKGQGPVHQGSYDKALIINGQEYHFRRAQMDQLPGGDYTFDLTC
jgi:pyruvate/2-oxoglutarate dehydrogenase complex dihydrolipoamide acyltransferase (E2) component